MTHDTVDEAKNPWITLETKKIYDNPWITVEEDQVLNPSGNPGIYGRVQFKNIAIGIIPLDENLNTWMVGQYRYSLREYSWEIPMGGGPLSIAPLESAKRELKEETGLSAKTWQNILKIHTSNSVTNEYGYVYMATDLQFGAPEFEETEDLVIRKLPFSEILQMVMNNEITDSLSIAGILKAARLIGV